VLIDASKKISTDISDTVRAQIITHMDGASVSELFNLPDAKSACGKPVAGDAWRRQLRSWDAKPPRHAGHRA
jgi:hypothetical protein